jgi:sulfate adenylyltransferase
LVRLISTEVAAEEWIRQRQSLPSLVLDARALADVEMLAIGAFSPLTGFLSQGDYESVIDSMRLADGPAWTIPVTLGVTREQAARFKEGKPVALLDGPNLIAILHLKQIYKANRRREAQLVYGTVDSAHPGVRMLMAQGEMLLGGKLEVLQLPSHSDFQSYRLTPAQTRTLFHDRGWKRVVGFQTRNPIHRAHEYITKTSLETVDGLLLHPLVGPTKADDIPADKRMRCYEVLMERYYPKERVILAVNPANMHYAGPREAVHHALVRKNFGCTHFIVGRDHAGVGKYYGTYDAQKIFDQFAPEELGITPLFFENSFYCKVCAGMASLKTCPHDDTDRVILSGTKVREMLAHKQLPPAEYARPEVAQLLV